MSHCLSKTLVSVWLLLVPAFSVFGQCPDWRARPTLEMSGLVGRVHDLTVWDPDGAGPQPARLVLGGAFQHVGGAASVAASNIATFDGQNWQPLGSGTDEPVDTLSVYNGQLVAGGDFTSPATRIASWDGATWHALAGGRGDIVYDMEPYVGELWVSNRLGGIDRWNGVAWQEGSGPDAYALRTIGGTIFAGRNPFAGIGDAVMRWNGTSWQNVEFGSNGQVRCLVSFNGEPIAGGIFESAGGAPASNIARFSGGTWHPLGDGLPGPVYALAVYHGELIAGGYFSSGGSLGLHHIARWNGTSWLPLGAGTSGVVLSLAVYNDELYVGGNFDVAGSASCESLAKWNGAWQSVPGVTGTPLSGTVYDVTAWNNRVVIGGSFMAAATNAPELAHNLAQFDGLTVTGLGGTNGIVLATETIPVSLVSEDLLIGGSFTSVSGIAANHIARLSSLPGSAWEALGEGFDGIVYDIKRHNGSIYAAGWFTHSGSTLVNHIARWDGAHWQPLGAGLSGLCMTLESFGGYLYAGGTFSTAGGVATGPLARWNGSTWSAVGGAFEGQVVALGIYENALIIGGFFSGAGGANNLLRWNGSTFSSIGGVGTDGGVFAITVSNGTLVIGGAFTHVGGLQREHMARWDGNAWTQWHHATDAPVYALTTFRNEIHAGGIFYNVRDGAIHSPLWARYSEDGIPWFAEQPHSRSALCGDNAHFSVRVAQGYGSVAYQWRRNGVPLVEGPTGFGSTIVIQADDLYVRDATDQDAGVYDVIITNGCGSQTSSPAILSVTGCCMGDLNGDGSIGLADLTILLAHFGQTSGAHFVDGDLDGDGDVDLSDLTALLASFGIMCP